MNTFSLSGDQLALLGALWPGERSILSPLHLPGDAGEMEHAKKALSGSGILDGSGSIGQMYHPVLAILSGATRTIEYSMTGFDQEQLFTRYFSPDTVSSVTVIAGDSNQVTVCRDLPVSELVRDIGSGADDGASPHQWFMIALPAGEMHVFAALFDLERESLIDHMSAAGNDPAPIPLRISGPGDVRMLIETCLEKPGIAILTGELAVAGSPHLLPETAIAQAFDMLVTRGFAIPSAGGYSIRRDLQEIARQSVRLVRFVTVEQKQCSADGGILAEDSIRMLGCGSNGLSLVRRTSKGDTLQFSDLPWKWGVTFIASLLEASGGSFGSLDAIPPLAPEIPDKKPSPSPAKHRFCSQCGAPVNPEKKFCPQCGAKIS
jgi:hypothetical protein